MLYGRMCGHIYFQTPIRSKILQDSDACLCSQTTQLIYTVWLKAEKGRKILRVRDKVDRSMKRIEYGDIISCLCVCVCASVGAG